VESKFYPSLVNAAALEGQLIHEVVEEWVKAVRRGEDPGSIRLRFKLAFRETISGLKGNPRVNAGRVAAAVSIDRCVAKAHDLICDLELGASSPRLAAIQGEEPLPRAPQSAEEFWISVDEPPLKGQLDRVRNGAVTDYKTGAPEEAHTKQLLFYAVLWWLKYGEPPKQLELRYPTTAVKVPVPSSGELNETAAALASEVEDATLLIHGGCPPARPNVEACRYCSVRQLCDEYWESPVTDELRLGGPNGLSQGGSPSNFGDVQLSQLPINRRADGAIFGEAMADGIGAVRVRFAAHLCPAVTVIVKRARVLAVRIAREDAEVMIMTTAGSEVFWQE
jgi:CRISPR/Cas system-associated exonuclease Cas4 (RecB family)